MLIANPPGAAAGEAVQNDEAIVESRTVASAALHLLGLNENPVTFVSQYTSTVVTDQVLAITVKNRSATVAISEANASAKSFLAFQTHLLLIQEQLVDGSLQEQVTQAEQNVSSLSSQISQLSSQPSSLSRKSQLSALRTERTRARPSDDAAADGTRTRPARGRNDHGAQGQPGARSCGGDPTVKEKAPRRVRRWRSAGRHGGRPGHRGHRCGRVRATSPPGRRIPCAGRARSAQRRTREGSKAKTAIIAPTQAPEVRRVAAHFAAALPATAHRPLSLAVVPVDDFQVPR